MGPDYANPYRKHGFARVLIDIPPKGQPQQVVFIRPEDIISFSTIGRDDGTSWTMRDGTRFVSFWKLDLWASIVFEGTVR